VRASAATSATVVPATAPVVPVAPPHWECIKGCGACCNIGGYDADILDELLFEKDDVALYNTMVGDDGWCVNLDPTSKACTVFEDRPWFCKVEQMATRNFNVAPEDVPQFANECCQYHIDLVYGDDSDNNSDVMRRYEETIGVNFAHLMDMDASEEEEQCPDDNKKQEKPANAQDDDDDDDDEIIWTDGEFDCEEEACEIPGFDVDVEEMAPLPDGSSSN